MFLKRNLLFFLFLNFSSFLLALEVFRPTSSLEEEFFSLSDPKEPFQIIFPSQNWIFQSTDNGVLYLSDVILKSEVRFNFKISALLREGKVPLKFFYQDLTKGEVFLKTLWINIPYKVNSKTTLSLEENDLEESNSFLSSTAKGVEGEEDFINWLDPTSFSKISEETIYRGKEQLMAWQDFDGALALTQERARRGKEVSSEMGDLYYFKGENRKAYEMYKKALKASPLEETLTITVLLGMLLEEDSLLDLLRYWITGFSSPDERVYLMVLSYLISHEDWELSFRWLNQYEIFYKKPEFKDYYYYLVGNFFELNSPYQDIYLSSQYYDKLLRDYPLSLYWDKAYDRFLIIKGFYMRY